MLCSCPVGILRKEFPMSVEQVAHDFVTHMNDPERLKELVAPDAMASGGVLPQALPVTQALGMVNALVTAMPDLSFDIEQTAVNGDQATVRVRWSGTQSGPLSLPLEGMPTLLPTGKKVSVKDAYVLTVQGDKVSHMRVESPADGGIPAALKQLGVEVPAM
jgi:predicted ester cyclase